MPGGDGTGPTGMGPMTGRGAGYCAGTPSPGFMNGGGGRGFRGRGNGRGWRNQFYATGLTGWQRAAVGWPGPGVAVAPGAPCPVPFPSAMSAEQQIDTLKGQAKFFEDALNGIRRRIEEVQIQTKKD